MTDPFEPLRREIILSYTETKGFAKHQLDGYDHWIEHTLPQIVGENSDIVVTSQNGKRRHKITFGKVTVTKPFLRENDGELQWIDPMSCRLRGITYASQVMVDMRHIVYAINPRTKEETVVENNHCVSQPLCYVPVMLRSRFCHLSTGLGSDKECQVDPGGYFIINGQEKVIVTQEKMTTNVPYIKSITGASSKFSHCCEIRSLHEERMRSTSTLTIMITDRTRNGITEIIVNVPFVKFEVPLVAVFRMLQVDNAADMESIILGGLPCSPEMLVIIRGILQHECIDMPFDELIEWIGKNGTKYPTKESRYRSLIHIIVNELLPHMGLDNSAKVCREKATYLGFALRKLLRVYMSEQDTDDRDHYANKILDTAGPLMALLFRQLYRTFLKTLTKRLQKNVDAGKFVNVTELINPKKIAQGFQYSLSTGNWTVQKNANTMHGVAQMLGRHSMSATVSHVRRVNKPINRDGKSAKPRQLHLSHWGIICAAETPEGASCGLNTNLALFCHVRIGYPASWIKDYMRAMPHVSVGGQPSANHMIMVNGVIFGTTDDPEALAMELRKRRQYQDIPFDTSIYIDHKQHVLCVNSYPGAPCRPVFTRRAFDRGLDGDLFIEHIAHRVRAHMPLWDAMMFEGVIEYIDKAEERCYNIAMTYEDALANDKYTHVEIAGISLLGICASQVCFAERNQAPRNMYSACMGKQQQGIYASNYGLRMDTVSHILWNPQKPLCKTLTYDALHLNETPAGTNAVVAILCYQGYNQEDSMIVNKAFLERGGFRSTVYRTYKDSEKDIGSDVQRFQVPPADCTGMRKANYSLLDEDGVVPVGTRVTKNDAIIGKITIPNSTGKRNGGTPRDMSTFINSSEQTTVDKVMLTTNRDGNKTVKVRTRACRMPTIGDKFASCHGQKGVIGMILPQEDMPFSSSGMSPDIIINPHAIPSRMTIAQLLEMLTGKKACSVGKVQNCTPFEKIDEKDLEKTLLDMGLPPSGKEVMYDGTTGKRMKAMVFMCPIYYQRLRHMVDDKVHARATGPVHLLTRQPVEGRSRDGAFRNGEMERDCMLAHGASKFIMDRLMEQSDAFGVFVCKQCGLIAQGGNSKMQWNHRVRTPYCKRCNANEVEKVVMPYAFKLLCQEMMGMGFAPRMVLADSANN